MKRGRVGYFRGEGRSDFIAVYHLDRKKAAGSAQCHLGPEPECLRSAGEICEDVGNEGNDLNDGAYKGANVRVSLTKTEHR